MTIEQDISLKPYNTFGLDVNAKHFVSVESTQELIEVLKLSKSCDNKAVSEVLGS